MSDFVPQTRDNEKENIGQQLPFLQMPSVLSMFVPVYFTEVFLFTALTQQITPLTLPLLFFLAGLLVTALECNRSFLWVKQPSPKAVENNRSLWFEISSRS